MERSNATGGRDAYVAWPTPRPRNGLGSLPQGLSDAGATSLHMSLGGGEGGCGGEGRAEQVQRGAALRGRTACFAHRARMPAGARAQQQSDRLGW